MIEELDYAFLTLQITKKPAFSTKADLEARAAECPEEWCHTNETVKAMGQSTSRASHKRHTSQLSLLLDLEYCVVTTAMGILDLIRFADSKVEDGTIRKRRLLSPTAKQWKKWARAIISREDSNLDYTAYSYRSDPPTRTFGGKLKISDTESEQVVDTKFEDVPKK
ncbi:hypothetical protein AYL99_11857 [Fonsecaea erecta]|uniref:Uncharacterized protein n=1 Tax=Fonsecaea erecta TaxID=1367422 RepID=A0A178Z2N5_9EURO|nr:hypothetical protein AYL99_11857 [Fonsecaea erecta]OAP53977.1 hypothetical protein AYL99_11857 [Fonsecaea erecta]